MPPQKSAIVDCSTPGGFIDPLIGAQYPIFSVFGTGTVSGANTINPQIPGGLFGNKVLRLNNTLAADYSMARLSKSFFVSPQNSFFQFAFISVFATGHSCCDAGAIQIQLKNSLNSTLACPNFSFSAPSANCTNPIPYTYYNAGSGTTYTSNVNYVCYVSYVASRASNLTNMFASGVCVAYVVYAYTIRFFQLSYTPFYVILSYTLYIYACMRVCIYA